MAPGRLAPFVRSVEAALDHGPWSASEVSTWLFVAERDAPSSGATGPSA